MVSAAPPEASLAEATPLSAAGGAVPPAAATVSGAPRTASAAQLRRERLLGGAVFSRAQDSSAAVPGAVPAAQELSRSVDGASPQSAHGGSGDALAALLSTPARATARAEVLPDRHLLLPKGAFIDCTLETAIDSTLPGMTTCITAADTFSADGTVVLLERGTKLIGETRGQVQQGQARVFVVWNEARTPSGISVPLDSPGTDELGRSGLPGQVERHFWERFGAAMLVSLVDGAVQAAVQSAASRSGGTIIYAPGASQDVLTEVLRNTMQIAPTVVKRNGDRIQVLVARDVDFRPVYELALAGR